MEPPKCPPPPVARKAPTRPVIPKAVLIKGANGIPLPPPGTRELPPLPSFDEMLKKSKTAKTAKTAFPTPVGKASIKEAAGGAANKMQTFVPKTVPKMSTLEIPVDFMEKNKGILLSIKTALNFKPQDL